MATRNNNDLFPQDTSLFGGPQNDGGLFATPKVQPMEDSRIAQRAIQQASKPLTPKQQAAQLGEQRSQYLNGLAEQLRSATEWQEATPERKQKMMDGWFTTKWPQAVQAMGVTDPMEAAELQGQLRMVLAQDRSLQQKLVDQTSQLDDTWKGTQAATKQLASGITDVAPAAYYQARIDNQTAILEKDGKPLTLGGVPQIDRNGNPIIERFTPEQRKKLEDEIAELTRARDAQLKDAATAQKEADAIRQSQSYGQRVRDKRLEEMQQDYGEGWGTAGYYVTNPGAALQIATENAPSALATIAASAAGQAIGIPVPVTLAATGAVFTGTDAGQGAYQQVMQMDNAELQAKSAPYRELIAQGLTPDKAKETLAARAAGDATLKGAALGIVASPVGEAVPLSRLAGNLVRGEGAGVARGYLGAVSSGALNAGSEFVEEYGTQVASNVGQNSATGIDGDITKGALAQGIQGIVAATPLSVGGSVATEAAARRSGAAPGDTTTGTGNDQTTAQEAPQAAPRAQEADDGSGLYTPPAAEATAETTATPEATTRPAAEPEAQAEVAAADAARQNMSAVYQDVMSRSGTELTQPEINSLFDAMYQAEQQASYNSGLIESALNHLQKNRAVPADVGSSLVESYRAHRSAAAEMDAHDVALNAVDAMQQWGTTPTAEFTNGRTDVTAAIPGVNYDSASLRAALNRGLETTTERSGTDTATAVSGDVSPVNGLTETTGLSGAERNTATENAGNPQADAAVGTPTAAEPAVSRPDNQPVPDSSTELSAGERDTGSAAGQRAADAGSAESISRSTTGRDLGVERQLAPRPADNPNITPEGRDMVGLRRAAYNAIASSDRTVLDAGSSLVRALESNDHAAADAAANVLESKGIAGAGRYFEPSQAAQPTATQEGSTLNPAEREQPDALNPAGQDVTHTPAGRDLQRLERQAERLLDSDTLFAEGADLARALEQGDYAKADTIAEALYAEGHRQFAPPQNNAGAGARTMRGAYMDLSPAERLALQREFDSVADALPADMSNMTAWRDAMVTEQLNEDAGTPSASPLFQRLSESARNIIRKMAKALAAIVVAVSLTNMVGITDARAAQGVGTVTQVTQVANLSQPANVVNSWIRQTHDNNGQRYVIADKAAGTIHIMDAAGNELATAPALYGKRTGDGMSLGETPAGVFMLHNQSAPHSYGGDLQQFATAPNGDIYAVHRVLTNNNQNRQGRLDTPTAADNRVSLGCINIPADIYNQYLNKGFQGKLYVLPDQKKLSEVFPGLVEQQAQAEQVQNTQMPEDLGNTANPQFESSTDQLAQTEPASLEQGYQATQEAQNVAQTEDSVPSEPGNTPAESLAWAALGFTVLRRRQSNEQKASGQTSEQESANAGTVPPNPEPSETRRAFNDAGSASNVSAMYDPTARTEQRGSRFRNRQAWYADMGWKMRNALIDAQTPLLRWLVDDAQQSPRGREFDDIPAWQELKLLPGRKAELEAEFRRNIMQPIDQHFAAVSRRTGKPITDVASHVATWVTTQHIPEANAALRANLQQRVDETLLLHPEDHAAALAALQAHDAAQRGGPRAPMAGGLTDAEAQRTAQAIEQMGYTPEELQRAQQLIVGGFQQLTQERVNSGVLEQETVDAWNAKGFKNFVSLFVDHSTDGDVFLGTSMFNPKGDYTREGSMTRANNAYATLTEYANRTAAGIASQNFKAEINRLAEAGVPGLHRGSAQSNPNAQGLFYSTTEQLPTGEEVRRQYKLWFDDENIMAGLSQARPDVNPVLGGLTRVTRGMFSLVTRFDPSFAPSNMVKDVQERALNLFARNLYDSNGAQVSASVLTRQMLAHAANPVLLKQTFQFLRSQNADGFYGRYAQELAQMGGVSTIAQMLGKDNSALQANLKKQLGVRKGGAAAVEALMQYNESFNMVSALSGYVAMRENGVPARDAAFRTLDMMNFRQQGTITPALSAFMPFVNPAFQSGYNMLRTLRTSRGKLAFGGLIIAGLVANGIARGIAGDDPDYGNKMDALGMGELSRFLPIFTDEGHFAKLPIGYGLPQVAWVTSVALDRARRGVMSYADAASQIALTFYKNISPADMPSYSFTDHPTAWLMATFAPAAIQPLVEAGTGVNAFGSPISYGGASEGERRSGHGQTRTPEFWQDFAKGLADISGGTLDYYPEDVRHIVNGYLMGPLRGITTYLEAEDAYKSGDNQRIQQELGVPLSTIGLQKFYGNDNAATSRMYYDRRSKVMARLRELDVPLSDKRNQGVEGAKERRIVAEMISRGASPEEAMEAKLVLEADKALRKNNEDMRERYKVFKQLDLELDTLAPAFQQQGIQREAIMRMYLNQARSLK